MQSVKMHFYSTVSHQQIRIASTQENKTFIEMHDPAYDAIRLDNITNQSNFNGQLTCPIVIITNVKFAYKLNLVYLLSSVTFLSHYSDNGY